MARAYIATETRRLVVERAQGCCEYCLLHQDDAETPNQIDHVIAIRHGGQTKIENLALACELCNRHKGTDLAAIDPVTSEVVRLFNPRTQAWRDHFDLAGVRVVGLTPTGRATVDLLRLNDQARLLDREALMNVGRYPPSDLR